ncbi:hypothetical protein [Streptomyces sp. NPDC058280]|uniref:hypothetical protein n=1 Tax=Streptomyces sp. NPDC058280 TaxID=3346419 RepID=UPI0036E31F13
MADNAALFGLIGAVGGAALGAGAAVIGPMLLHRQQARLHRDEVGRTEEREDREALTRRLINVRASTRNYPGFLARSYREISGGNRVSPEVFESDFEAIHSELNSAFDEALLDGIWFAHARAANFLIERSPLLTALGHNVPGRVDATTLGHHLIAASDLVRACIEHGPPIPEGMRRETEAAPVELEVARDELVAYIKGRLNAQSQGW